jgi:glycolate oxidase iron-sulfur subunit
MSDNARPAEGPPVASTVADAEAQRLRSVVKDCVHCGFCLPACPTYQLWGEEMDSPRGRIHLVSQILDGAPLTAAAAGHFDRCLGCMACMTACPSGVQYDQIIEAAREWTEEAAAGPPAPEGGLPAEGGAPSAAEGVPSGGPGRARRPLRDRATRAAIFSVFPYPGRLRALTAPLRAAQRVHLDRVLSRTGALGLVSPAAEAALRLAPPAARPFPAGRFPSRVPARGTRRAVVGMLTGCVQSVFFPQVNAATARVLAAEGCDVIIPRGQGCCGALSLHSGRAAEAARFARRTIETFEAAGVDAIVVNSAGCGSAMKEYERLFGHLAPADAGTSPDAGASPALAGQVEGASWAARAAAFSARVRDLAEFLAELGVVAPRHPVPVKAAYHDACHLGHAQRITRQPRDLLRGIPGLELVELRDAGTCCGSAGVYNLLQPEAARALGSRKADAVLASGASLVISANPGCTLQISAELAARGQSVVTAHTAEILDASIRGVPPRGVPPRPA